MIRLYTEMKMEISEGNFDSLPEVCGVQLNSILLQYVYTTAVCLYYCSMSILLQYVYTLTLLC